MHLERQKQQQVSAIVKPFVRLPHHLSPLDPLYSGDLVCLRASTHPLPLVMNTRLSFHEKWGGGDDRNMCCQSDIQFWALLMVCLRQLTSLNILSLTFTPCVLLPAGLASSVYFEKDAPLLRNLCNKCCVLSIYIWQKNVYPINTSDIYTHMCQ